MPVLSAAWLFGIDRRGHAADEEVLQMRILAAEDRVDLDELALPVERFEIVRHSHEIRFRRQPVGGMAPVGVREGPSWPLSTNALTRSRTPAKYFGLDSGQSEIDCGERRGLRRIGLQRRHDVDPVERGQMVEVHDMILHALRRR